MRSAQRFLPIASIKQRLLLNMSQNKPSWLVGKRPFFCVSNFRALVIFGHTKQLPLSKWLLCFQQRRHCFLSVLHYTLKRWKGRPRSTYRQEMQGIKIIKQRMFTDLWRLDDEKLHQQSMIFNDFQVKFLFFFGVWMCCLQVVVTSLEVIRPNDEAVTWGSGSDDDVAWRKMIMSEQIVDPHVVFNTMDVFKIIQMKITIWRCFLKISIQTMDLNYVWFVRSHEWKKIP